MRNARCVVVVVTAVLSSVLLASCKTDLGECDEMMLGGSSMTAPGKPNTGQVVLEKTCAGGRCHASTAKGKDRVGVPAGLNFDVLPSDTSMPELARITKSAKVVKDHADEMWEEIQDGEMPPKNQGRSLSSDDKESLRNWLACGAPVIDAPVSVDTTSGYDGIYKGLTDQSCLSCHSGTADAGGGFMLGMTACESYKNIFMKPAITTVGTPACAASGLQLVVPNSPDTSLLLQKLEGMPKCGSPMPLGSMGLGASNATVMALRAWIMSGAPAPAGCM